MFDGILKRVVADLGGILKTAVVYRQTLRVGIFNSLCGGGFVPAPVLYLKPIFVNARHEILRIVEENCMHHQAKN